jgi:hypothetical protein
MHPLLGGADVRRRWEYLVDRSSGWVEARGYPAYAYIVAVVLGMASWLVNVRNTIHPEYPNHYSHDVFDGWSHVVGFVVFKICLFASWVVVFPIVGYLLLMMSYATWATLHSAQRNKLLAARVTHPDGCYGFAKFGELNISILAPFLLAYAVMLSLWLTHARPYETLLLPMAGMTIAFLSASYFALYPLYIVIRDARTKMFDKLRDQATELNDEDRTQFTIERLCFESAKSTPYDSGMRLFLLAMRGLTIGTTAVTFFVRYRGLIGI